MQLVNRQWNLSKSQRLFIVLCAGLYLLVFHLWSRAATNGAASVYAGVAAMLVLASLPSKIRLLSALALAVVVAFVDMVGLHAIGIQA